MAVSGVLRDAVGVPVAGASVGFGASALATGADGSFVLHVPAGTTASLTAYVGSFGSPIAYSAGPMRVTSDPFTVIGDTVKDIALPPIARLHVHVTDATGAPLANAGVRTLDAVHGNDPIVATGTLPDGTPVTFSWSQTLALYGYDSCGTDATGSCDLYGLVGWTAPVNVDYVVPGYPPATPVTTQAIFNGVSSDLTIQLNGYAELASAGATAGTIAVVAPSGASLSAVSNSVVDPTVLPAGAVAVSGNLSYTVNGVGTGATIDIVIQLPAGSTPTAVYKNSARGLVDVSAIATIANDRITLHVTDGGLGDQDGIANGVIVDPLIPVHQTFVAPQITAGPASQSVLRGQVFTFTAAASGVPAPSAQWQVSSDHGATFTDVPGATGSIYSAIASATDSGHVYRVEFTNSAGTAISANAVLIVTLPVPTISINNIPTAAQYGNDFTATYSYTGDGTASVSSSTPATCSTSVSVVRFTAAGLCTLIATATATANFQAAAGTPQFFTIAKANQTLVFAQPSSPLAYGTSFLVTPTASSGLQVAIVATGGCTATPPALVTATGWNITMTSGAVACVLAATQPGDGNYNPAPTIQRTVTATKATPTVSINNLPTSATFGGQFAPMFAYTGNGSTSATSSTPASCTAAPNGVVRFTGVGTCTLVAHATATADVRAAIGTPQTVKIGKATAAVTISNIPANPRVGGTFEPSVVYAGDGATSVTSSTQGTCVVGVRGIVRFTSSGSCTLVAHATTTSHYVAATGNPQSFTIRR